MLLGIENYAFTKTKLDHVTDHVHHHGIVLAPIEIFRSLTRTSITTAPFIAPQMLQLALRVAHGPAISFGGLFPRVPAATLRLPALRITHIVGSLMSISLHIPSLLPRLFPSMFPNEASGSLAGEGILNAAPKKKPSYRRTRQKRLAPGDKQIQPLENLGRCPACGRVKRSHFMCMYCFAEIRTFLKEKKKALMEIIEPEKLDPIDEKIIYPGKHIRAYERRLKKKEWIPVREEPLMFRLDQVKKEKVK